MWDLAGPCHNLGMEAQRCHQPLPLSSSPRKGPGVGCSLSLGPIFHSARCPRKPVSPRQTAPAPSLASCGFCQWELCWEAAAGQGEAGHQHVYPTLLPSLASAAPRCPCLSRLATVLAFFQSWGHLSASACPSRPAGSDASPPFLAPSGGCKIPCLLPYPKLLLEVMPLVDTPGGRLGAEAGSTQCFPARGPPTGHLCRGGGG